MAYSHSRYEVEMLGFANVTDFVNATDPGQMGQAIVTIAFAEWGPGMVPHRIRAAAVIMTGDSANVAFGGTAVGVRFEADISVPGTVTLAFRIHIPTAVTGHNNFSIYYIPTYVIEIAPGGKIQARATTAPTALSVRCRTMLYVEPRWEEPINVTTMSKSTGN